MEGLPLAEMHVGKLTDCVRPMESQKLDTRGDRLAHPNGLIYKPSICPYCLHFCYWCQGFYLQVSAERSFSWASHYLEKVVVSALEYAWNVWRQDLLGQEVDLTLNLSSVGFLFFVLVTVSKAIGYFIWIRYALERLCYFSLWVSKQNKFVNTQFPSRLPCQHVFKFPNFLYASHDDCQLFIKNNVSARVETLGLGLADITL